MKGIWKALIIVFALITALTLVYFLGFHKMVFVSDISFAANFSKTELLPLRLELFKNFYRLKVVEIDNRSLMDSELLSLTLEGFNKYDLLMLTPVTANFCKLYSLNVSSLLDHTVVIGIVKNGNNLFDVALDSSDINVPDGSVDYRYRYTTEDAESVVMPDLFNSVKPYLKLSKEEANHISGVLLYEERSTR